jgi:hypothetical protein
MYVEYLEEVQSSKQSVGRLHVVRIINLGQAYSIGPGWEFLDSVQRTVLNNQPRKLKTMRSKEEVSSLRRVFPAVLPQLKPSGANVH